MHTVTGVDANSNPVFREVVSAVNLDGSPIGGNAPTLSDVLLTDSSGALFIARDNGTTIAYRNLNTGAAYTPTGTIQVADTLAAGTDNTGAAQPASGSGIRGWLSAIYLKLLSTLFTLDAPMASLIDSTTTAGYVYFLQALPNTLTSASTGWQICRMQTSNAQVQWPTATGATYTNAGTGYAALSYS